MSAPTTGYLLLEDGTVFRGRSVAAEGTGFGEVVFTTGMTGYQETVTDPSYAEQLVCFTAPMVGNYGVDERRLESAAPHARAVLMRRLGGEDWALWLAERGIVALDEIDTRALTLRLRDGGAMRGVAVADERALPVDDALEQVRAQPPMEGAALVARGLDARAVRLAERRAACSVAVVDYGAQALDHAAARRGGRRRHRLPARRATRTSSPRHDGVLLSNGPGDPAPLVEETRRRPRDARPRADARHLPRPPADGARDRPRDDEAAVRPPRRQPSRCSTGAPGACS